MSLQEQAASFISTCYQELGIDATTLGDRLQQVKVEIEETGTYTHTYEELVHGAKMAWRNSNKCIGRLFWETMNVFDAREVKEESEVFNTLKNHMTFATNEGRIRPTITVFAPEKDGKAPVRVINHQLARYAGYEHPDGTVIGDPDSIAFTKLCQDLGWQGKGSAFDLLPIVIKLDSTLVLQEFESDIVLEVPFEHPEEPSFKELDLKWYAVPAISDMQLEIGGITYPTAPFNGWYMGTEIGARNLADSFRYDKLKEVAEVFHLDTSKTSALWKDRALVELNRAVLHSFQENRVSIVDHHTAAEQFRKFQQREERAEREVTGDWTWLIPPVSPAATHIFHQGFKNEEKSPNFFYQDKLYDESGKMKE
ncbi:nitric oxide synthase oxygenase [Paenalkalicoccus suaedae]|uniref:Nitric oxide synthase oxygenase n=1 Tax=Paenalkalicoccus suaedae TaxID=2592382 RepID=A0A859FB94_9BACI|nr:nitric oxide synthase oxygenase [Paenalkalicoccus suaedae]QKS70539.1 nitric oxide synthase oxygenase [Paenalkalicoccus suaedae]